MNERKAKNVSPILVSWLIQFFKIWFVLFSHQNAIKNKVKSIGSGEKRDHWMDYAKKDYDVSSTELVTFFYLQLIIFWCSHIPVFKLSLMIIVLVFLSQTWWRTSKHCSKFFSCFYLCLCSGRCLINRWDILFLDA